MPVRPVSGGDSDGEGVETLRTGSSRTSSPGTQDGPSPPSPSSSPIPTVALTSSGPTTSPTSGVFVGHTVRPSGTDGVLGRTSSRGCSRVFGGRGVPTRDTRELRGPTREGTLEPRPRCPRSGAPTFSSGRGRTYRPSGPEGRPTTSSSRVVPSPRSPSGPRTLGGDRGGGDGGRPCRSTRP